MAQVKRPNGRARGGGKLALFEIIQAAQSTGDEHLNDAVAPLVQATTQREPAAPAPVAPAAPAPATAPAPAARQVLVAPVRPSNARKAEGISAISFATAIAALVTVGAGGYLLAQRFTSRPASQVSESAPIPEVLDVGRPGTTPAPAGGELANRLPQVQTEVRPQSRVVIPDGFRRTNGMNYVLMQSYAPSEESQAIAARDALLDAGVGATIERGIRGWEKRICVVGTYGFERMSGNDEYRTYRSHLDQVVRRFNSNRKLKDLQPMELQWGR